MAIFECVSGYLIGFWAANLFTRAVPISPKFNWMVLTTLITLGFCKFF